MPKPDDLQITDHPGGLETDPASSKAIFPLFHAESFNSCYQRQVNGLSFQHWHVLSLKEFPVVFAGKALENAESR